LLAFRAIERRLELADRLAGCLKDDPRMPEKVVHGLAEIIRFRMLMIAAGYEDGNDAGRLRSHPMYKLGLDACHRASNDLTAGKFARLAGAGAPRAGVARFEQYCGSFAAVPKRILWATRRLPR
jgi:hypothetical protein